jgi:hypothetical protein
LVFAPIKVISKMSISPDKSPPTGVTDNATSDPSPANTEDVSADATKPERPVEIGGRKGPDPTRYGDWEKNGRCIDF